MQTPDSNQKPSPRQFGALAVLIVATMILPASGQTPGPGGPMNPDQQALFRSLSLGYSLDGQAVPKVFPTRDEWQQFIRSSDPLVRAVGQSWVNHDDFNNIANAKKEQLDSGQAFAEESRRLNDFFQTHPHQSDLADLVNMSHYLANSPAIEQAQWINALDEEVFADQREMMAKLRADLVRHSLDHQRGGRLEPNAIALGYADNGNAGVDCRLRNETGRTLHNCLIVAILKTDGQKVDAQDNGDPLSNAIGQIGTAAVNPSAGMQKAGAAYRKARDRVYRADSGIILFVPEWLSGQLIESGLINYTMLRLLGSAELTVAADEGVVSPLPVPLPALYAALSRPAAPAFQSRIPVPTPAPTSADVEAALWKQKASVTETASNGFIYYQFLAYPEVWSEAFVLPPGATGHAVAYADGKRIAAMVNGQRVPNPNQFSCPEEARVRFMSLSGEPVPTAFRVSLRQLTPEESQIKFVLPSQPATPAVLTPGRQAMVDRLLTCLRHGTNFTGTLVQGQTTWDAEASLVWDDQTRSATGWIYFPKLKAKKRIEGRIVDDGTNPIWLQLIETGFIGGSHGNALMGIYYSLRPDATVAGALSGHWQLARQSGAVSLQLAAN